MCLNCSKQLKFVVPNSVFSVLCLERFDMHDWLAHKTLLSGLRALVCRIANPLYQRFVGQTIDIADVLKHHFIMSDTNWFLISQWTYHHSCCINHREEEEVYSAQAMNNQNSIPRKRFKRWFKKSNLVRQCKINLHNTTFWPLIL